MEKVITMNKQPQFWIPKSIPDLTEFFQKEMQTAGAALVGFADLRVLETRPFSELPVGVAIALEFDDPYLARNPGASEADPRYIEAYYRNGRRLDPVVDKGVEILRLNRSFTLGQCLSWWGLTLILIVLGAHFYRAGQYGLTLCSFGFLAFNSTHSGWKKYVVAFFLICGAMEWSRTVYNLVLIRQQFGLPWLRGALILSIVASLTAFSGYFAYVRAGKMRKADDKPLFMAVVFTLTFMLLWLMTTNQGAANPDIS